MQDLVRGRGLLEARGRVDGVAGHQPLAARRVAGDDLAGVHAGPVGQADAPAPLELVVQLGERVLHARRPPAPRAARRPRGRVGRPKTAMIASPMYFSIGAAVRSSSARIVVEVAGHHLAQRLGVEPLAEARRALQVREDDRDGLADLLGGQRPRAASGVPQNPHRRNRSGFSSPQFGQISIAPVPSAIGRGQGRFRTGPSMPVPGVLDLAPWIPRRDAELDEHVAVPVEPLEQDAGSAVGYRSRGRNTKGGYRPARPRSSRRTCSRTTSSAS